MNPYRKIASNLKTFRDGADYTQSDLSIRVAKILQPELITAEQLERTRRMFNLTQHELTTYVNGVLGNIDSVGMPTRMATSKVENARRRLDFLEAMAVCIALKIPPWAMLPETLQKMQPQLCLSKLWIFQDQVEDCYLFEHVYSPKLLFTLSITPQLDLTHSPKRKHLDLADVVSNNPWTENLVVPLLADPKLNPTPMDLTVLPSGELKWTTPR